MVRDIHILEYFWYGRRVHGKDSGNRNTGF